MHAAERHLVGRDHVHVDLARAQRRRDLEADEAGADDDGARCLRWRAAMMARLSSSVRR